MRTDHITLIDGRVVCMAFTPVALTMVNELTGKELGDLTGSGRNLALIRTMAWCSIVEGEIIEGRKFNLSEDEFWRLVTIPQIGEISRILAEHITGIPQKKSQAPEKSPKVHARKS
jgi:hypothetical protein